jgi:hypothetical protein
MSAPYIYADFNGIEYTNETKAEAILDLNGYGTLASLARLNLYLTEGMPLVLYEPNDIEATGIAHFDKNRRDPAGRVGAWVAHINSSNIQASTYAREPSSEHPCMSCRQDLNPYLSKVGRAYKEICPYCGTSIMAPLSPPGAQPNHSFKGTPNGAP